MSPEIKERVSNLEALLGHFIVQTEKTISELKEEMAEFKDEMADFKDEMSDFKIEMAEFKNEMSDFKNEMSDFKNEMSDFKNEMSDFKNEMSDYRIRSEEERKQERKEWFKKWGELSNKMGTIIEDLFAPSVPRLAKEHLGCVEVLEVFREATVRHPKDRSRSREFDVVVVCKSKVILCEVKATCRPGYIEDFIVSLDSFFEYYPKYKKKKLIPIFASLNIPENYLKQLTRRKIYAMAMGDETMVILNADKIEQD